MATVNGMTAEAMIAIRDNVVVGGVIDGSGHLVLTKYDGTTIDAGSVIGPTGAPGVTSGELATELSDFLPVNSIIEYNGATPPNSKWLAMAGQTVANAQTLYPAWWAVIPAGMKSGSSAIMPDTRGKVSVGYNTGDVDFDTIGETGGSKTHTLTQAELPAASVTVNPPATAVTGNTGNDTVDHYHGAASAGTIYMMTDGTHIAISPGSGYVVYYPLSVGPTNTGPATAPHQHTAGSLAVDIPQFNSGNMGSGAAHSIVQPYITLLKMVKVL